MYDDTITDCFNDININTVNLNSRSPRSRISCSSAHRCQWISCVDSEVFSTAVQKQMRKRAKQHKTRNLELPILTTFTTIIPRESNVRMIPSSCCTKRSLFFPNLKILRSHLDSCNSLAAEWALSRFCSADVTILLRLFLAIIHANCSCCVSYTIFSCT